MKRPRWTKEEIELLYSLYPDPSLEIADIASNFVGRSAMAVHLKAHSLDLHKNWTEEEENLLISCYQNPAISTREICRRLKRDKKSVYCKAGHLGISRPPQQNRSHPWSEDQINLLIQNWNKDSDIIRDLIPEKSDRAISAMSKKLDLPKRPFGDGFTRKRNWYDRQKYINEDSVCTVPGCVGWELVLDVHHNPDEKIFTICPGHHAMITRGYAKIIDGVFTPLFAF